MSSITRSHAVSPLRTQHLRTEPVRTAPVLVALPEPAAASMPEVAERVSARAHAAGAVPGVSLVPGVEDEPSTDGIRFLGAGWAADAAVFAQYRRRGD